MHNEIKLSFTDYQYYINNAKRTVTCKVVCTLNTPYNVSRLYSELRFSNFNLNLPYLDRFVVRATAHLNPSDNFDEETGIKIARAKAESIAYEKVRKHLKKLYEVLSEVNNHIAYFSNKALNVVYHNDEYLSSF